MYAKITLPHYPHLIIEVNGPQVTVTDRHSNEVMFQREAGTQQWFDAEHRNLVKALETLQASLLSLTLMSTGIRRL